MWEAPPWVEHIYQSYITGKGRGDELSSLFSFLLFNRDKDKRLKANIALLIARIFLFRGNLHLALSFIRLAVSFGAGRDPGLQIGLLINRAVAFAMSGYEKRAEHILKHTFRLSLHSGEVRLAAESALNLASVITRKEEPDKVLELASFARTIYESLDYSYKLVRVEQVLAMAELEHGRIEEAKEYAAASLSAAGRLGLGRELLEGICLLAEIGLREKSYDDVEGFIEEGLAKGELVKRFLPQRQSLYALKYLFYKVRGKKQEAEVALREAERIESNYLLKCVFISCGRDGSSKNANAYITELNAHEPTCEYTCSGRVLFKEQVVSNKERTGRHPVQVDGRIDADGMSGNTSGRMFNEGVFLTSDPSLVKLLSRVKDVSTLPLPILITGETGVGKEAVARFIHRWSGRGSKPFIPINAAAIPAELFESIFFGHKKGAFTGAVAGSTGVFEGAGDGTVFIDEIGELPVSLQSKLLRVIESGEYLSLGDNRIKYSGARVVAATNRSLDEEVRSGNFRSDLYHRISILSFTVPPLRDRVSDISLLADHYLDHYIEKLDLAPLVFSSRALRALSGYNWPGNVRELKGEVLKSTLRASSGEIKTYHLSRHVILGGVSREGTTYGLDNRIRVVEFEAILKALEASAWVVAEAARRLGIKRTTLFYRMKRLGIS